MVIYAILMVGGATSHDDERAIAQLFFAAGSRSHEQ